jgi:hypothetical protein
MGKFKKGDQIQVPNTIRGILPAIIGVKGQVITEVPERSMPSTYGEGDAVYLIRFEGVSDAQFVEEHNLQSA